jgi:hypothetical protein
VSPEGVGKVCAFLFLLAQLFFVAIMHKTINYLLMKTKSLLLLVLCAFTAFAWADDTIYLKNGEEIKAKVSKIGTSSIEYKKITNLDGPTYELLKNDILMVIYENGEKEIFQNQPTYPSYSNSNAGYFENNVPFGTVEYEGDKILSYNGNYISEDQYVEIARKNCIVAYNQFAKGQKLKKAGVICLSIGTPLTATGIILFSIGISHVYYPDLAISGSVFMSAGFPTMVAGIPLYCIGKNMREKSYGTFNEQSKKNTYASELRFQINNNGVGLALQF